MELATRQSFIAPANSGVQGIAGTPFSEVAATAAAALRQVVVSILMRRQTTSPSPRFRETCLLAAALVLFINRDTMCYAPIKPGPASLE
jgi:hypothetical protein